MSRYGYGALALIVILLAAFALVGATQGWFSNTARPIRTSATTSEVHDEGKNVVVSCDDNCKPSSADCEKCKPSPSSGCGNSMSIDNKGQGTVNVAINCGGGQAENKVYPTHKVEIPVIHAPRGPIKTRPVIKHPCCQAPVLATPAPPKECSITVDLLGPDGKPSRSSYPLVITAEGGRLGNWSNPKKITLSGGETQVMVPCNLAYSTEIGLCLDNKRTEVLGLDQLIIARREVEAGHSVLNPGKPIWFRERSPRK